MKKLNLLIVSGFSFFCFAFSEATISQQNPTSYNTNNKPSEIIKQMGAEASSHPQVQYGKSFNDEFENFGKDKKINKLYYRNMIKQRAKRNPKKYKFKIIRKRSDLQKVGVEVKDKKRVREVYNYTEIKNITSTSLHDNKEKNVGVVIDKKAKLRKVVNIVDIKNVHTNEKLNSGVEIKSKKLPSKIINSVQIKNSKIGE
ncbi:hypothetical protein [Nitratiruptor tergarcus]|uniref:Uncharacterized protein n=1 Tax=Nitratiruptor tergarcus DSM 16512 TaxID=1069081 RepID=A0A1W1WRD6_9BACT|nr:hypothetical protein [Nitratiruptor tergarcus]SMC08779.1 hypothetical protein SAMN05660197_0546 [Nitratiruptor tergarcus DSM 16512]